MKTKLFDYFYLGLCISVMVGGILVASDANAACNLTLYKKKISARTAYIGKPPIINLSSKAVIALSQVCQVSYKALPIAAQNYMINEKIKKLKEKLGK